MRKDFKIIFTILGIAVLSGVFPFGNIVMANDEDLIVEFEQEPLFSETNLSPGNSVTRWIKVSNNSGSTQKIAIKADNIQKCSEEKCLADMLDIVIKEGIKEGGTELYNDSLTQFYDEGEIFLSELASDNNTQYDITVIFNEIAENKYQDKSTGFDLVIGFQEIEPEEEETTGIVLGAATGPSEETIPQKIGRVLGAATGSPVFIVVLISVVLALTFYFFNTKLKANSSKK